MSHATDTARAALSVCRGAIEYPGKVHMRRPLNPVHWLSRVRHRLVAALLPRRLVVATASEKINHEGAPKYPYRSLNDDEMAREAAFFKSIADNVADFVAVLDTDGRRLYNSPSYDRFFGNAVALRGTDSFKHIHPDDRELVKTTFSQTVKTGIGQLIEYRFLLPDGSVRHMESRGAVVVGAGGSVTRVIVTASDITERKLREEKMCEYAYFDQLTGLPNRRMLMDHLHQAIRQSRRSGQFNALLFIDLDAFKSINDDFGHAAGDRLLREVAIRAKACTRETDTVARLGGDEFVVLIKQIDTDADMAVAVAARVAKGLTRELARPHFIDESGQRRVVIERICPASIGVTLFDGQASAPGVILHEADQAMYLAKSDGGNRVRFQHPKSRRRTDGSVASESAGPHAPKASVH